MSADRIIVCGPAVRVGIVGAYLAARWASEGRELVIVAEDEETDEAVLLRPGFERFHGEVGLAPDTLSGAAPALATSVPTHDGVIEFPFSPFGMANAGVDFHHYWQRAGKVSEQPGLPEFSLALALADKAERADLSKLPVAVGLRISRRAYSQALLSLAERHGAQLDPVFDASVSEHSLLVDCRNSNARPRWEGTQLVVASDHDIDGIESAICIGAARRLVALMADLGNNSAEQAEYNRLAEQEVERIADMRELLACVDPRSTSRQALKRKVDLFEACGRIPTEDFEVFLPPEWLAALWSRGVRPRRHDRMASAMPEADLLQWLAALRRQIGEIAGGSYAA